MSKRWVKRNTRSWVGCDVCGKDIKWGTSETEYWQKNGHGKRYCRTCYLKEKGVANYAKGL